MKRFSELNKEEIDEVAEKIRRISPKFEDLFRPEVRGTQKELEYEQEVEKIAARSENIFAVMPPRKKPVVQENITKKDSQEKEKISEEETTNNSRREKKNKHNSQL